MIINGWVTKVVAIGKGIPVTHEPGFDVIARFLKEIRSDCAIDAAGKTDQHFHFTTSLLSSHKVNGPSLTKETFISAWKTPVCISGQSSRI